MAPISERDEIRRAIFVSWAVLTITRNPIYRLSNMKQAYIDFGKMGFAGSGFLAIAAPVAFGIAGLIPAHAQILHANGPTPSFEVVSIRPWKPAPMPLPPPPLDRTDARPKGPMKVDPGPGVERGQRSDRVHVIWPLEILISSAYNLPPSSDRLLGLPDWVRQATDQYEIDAKIEESLFAAMQKMTPAEQREQVELMEQSLLADRFKLKLHFETREMPAYALVVAKGGPKLALAKDGESSRIFDTRENEQGTETTATAVTLEQFVHSVLLFGGRRVVDQTGLKGAYDFTLTWRSDRLIAAGTGLENGTDAPPLFTAIQEQLGLRVVPTKDVIEVIVIDHVEKPSEN